MPNRFHRFVLAFLAVPLIACLLACTSKAGVVFSDKFDNGDVSAAGPIKDFWTVMQPGNNLDNVASEKDGHLSLLASTNAFASISLASRKAETFGFFAHPITVVLDGLLLKAKGISDNEARFRISLVSAAGTTPELSDNVITVRVRAGLLLMGYRASGYKVGGPPETLAGDHVNSVAVLRLKGVPSKISLTLGPAMTDGFVGYDIVAVENGLPVESKGTFPLTLAQWGGADAAALIVDARRDNASSAVDTGTQFSVSQITVTR